VLEPDHFEGETDALEQRGQTTILTVCEPELAASPRLQRDHAPYSSEPAGTGLPIAGTLRLCVEVFQHFNRGLDLGCGFLQ
jgi:hypothetical protein